ncbi:chitinase-3-like protein 1 [Mercenaria mercenaria]|uniref:chitinase-3-like protein 1 n=1 Tax=Mercenaria mercenaria TaxID=6596 RepID=UPI001E1DCF3D|nr:chitinase-3-like protein 1 [Mercenaria mercenaria]
MEHIKTKRKTLCILILVLVCNFMFSTGISWTRYNYRFYFSGYRCVPNETIFQKDDVFDSVTCGRMCYVTKQCLSYVYQPDSHQCIGCRVHGEKWAGHYDALPGSMYLSRSCDQTYLRVGYYDSPAIYRSGGKYTPDNVDARLCTHIIYSFAGIANNTLRMALLNDGKMFKKLQKLKVSNPCLKTLIAVGGYEGASSDYSLMMESKENRLKFIESARSFLRTYGFNGVDLKWEHSVQESKPEDKQNLVLLAKEMKEAFVIDGYLLSAEVPARQWEIEGKYDEKALAEHLDFIHVTTYDLHLDMHTNSYTGLHSPLYLSSQALAEDTSLNSAAEYWISKGVPKKKLIIGIATYGRTFTLLNEGESMIDAPTIGLGGPGEFTLKPGLLSYYEICLMQERGLGIEHWDDEQKGPYYVNRLLWVGYDNVRSISEKMSWLKEKGYGGVVMNSLDLDDYGQVCKSSSRPYPLLNAINDHLTSGLEKTAQDQK